MILNASHIRLRRFMSWKIITGKTASTGTAYVAEAHCLQHRLYAQSGPDRFHAARARVGQGTPLPSVPTTPRWRCNAMHDCQYGSELKHSAPGCDDMADTGISPSDKCCDVSREVTGTPYATSAARATGNTTWMAGTIPRSSKTSSIYPTSAGYPATTDL